jgi:ABC-type polar amino acid transport system ATPase subunit
MKKMFACSMILTALCAVPAMAATKTLTGVVTDDMCGAKHMMAGKSDAECTKACVKHGAKFALAVKDEVYILDGMSTEVGALAGQKATVSGDLNGKTLTVSSVAAAK